MSTPESEPKWKKWSSLVPSGVVGCVLVWLNSRSYDTWVTILALTLIGVSVVVIVLAKFWKRDGPVSLDGPHFTRESMIPAWGRWAALGLLVVVSCVWAVVHFCLPPLTQVAVMEDCLPLGKPGFYALVGDQNEELQLHEGVAFTVTKRSPAETVTIQEVRLKVTQVAVKKVGPLVGSLPGNAIPPNEYRAKLSGKSPTVTATMLDGEKEVPGGVTILNDKQRFANIRVVVDGDEGAYKISPEVTVKDAAGRVQTLTFPESVYVYVPGPVK